MKKNTTFKSRMVRFLLEISVVALVLSILSVSVYRIMDQSHKDSMNQLLNLNTFFDGLKVINDSVYEYTLEGNEEIYREIEQDCMEGRRILKKMAEMQVDMAFYRDIRDMEEMFYSYTECIQRIYDHSYLCDAMTIGSKRTINRYYAQTQTAYEAINSEFQSLYSRLLDAAGKREQKLEWRSRVYFADLILVILCTIIYEFFNIRKIMRRVIDPVQELTESASRFDGENLDQIRTTPQYMEMDEEMEQLHQVYNSMIRRIQRQVMEIRENASTMERLKNQELENLRISNLLKASELKALQMQINPHFLFNTLNMISQTAYLESAEQTAGLLGKTARLLRYSLDYSGREVTLAREIEILGNYVELQEQRFGERISFSFDLDESFHQTRVPSLLLQPLVENCITHGVGMKGEGAKIAICTSYDPQQQLGRIEIADNGEGMSEETLERVRREMKENKEISQKIGLNNVYLRLMIFFNRQASMEIFSLQGEGTRIEITIPCKEALPGQEHLV